MESDAAEARSPEPVDRDAPSPAEARAALTALDADGALLAQRVATPWWYHPILALIVAAIIGSQALPGNGGLVVLPLALLGLTLLVVTYTRHTGVSTTRPAGPRSRRLLFVLVCLMMVGLVSSTALKLTGSSPTWALLPAAVVALATLVLGRRYDDALRTELARPTSARP